MGMLEHGVPQNSMVQKFKTSLPPSTNSTNWMVKNHLKKKKIRKPCKVFKDHVNNCQQLPLNITSAMVTCASLRKARALQDVLLQEATWFSGCKRVSVELDDK